ncbi:MAG: hypothetical protein ABFD92_20620 [Planctomycetaceae bacterium]|nr:hypothetical protein [Planctomycetaceae bacterium]
MKQIMVISALGAILLLASGCTCGRDRAVATSSRDRAVATSGCGACNGTACCHMDPLNCVHCATPTESADERDFRVAQIQDLQDKQRTDDWDAFWLIDHSTRLSYWHAGFGHP